MAALLLLPPSTFALEEEEVSPQSFNVTVEVLQHNQRTVNINGTFAALVTVTVIEGRAIDVVVASYVFNEMLDYEDKYEYLHISQACIEYMGDYKQDEAYVVLDNSDHVGYPAQGNTEVLVTYTPVAESSSSGDTTHPRSYLMSLWGASRITAIITVSIALLPIYLALRWKKRRNYLDMVGQMEQAEDRTSHLIGKKENACPCCGALWKQDPRAGSFHCPYCKCSAPESFEGHGIPGECTPAGVATAKPEVTQGQTPAYTAPPTAAPANPAPPAAAPAHTAPPAAAPANPAPPGPASAGPAQAGPAPEPPDQAPMSDIKKQVWKET